MTRDEIAQLQSRPPRPLRDRALLAAILLTNAAVWVLAVLAIWWWLR